MVCLPFWSGTTGGHSQGWRSQQGLRHAGPRRGAPPGREVECPLCPHVPIQPLLLRLLQVLPTWQSQAVPVPVGSPAGRRLSPPTPQATAPARPLLGASGGGPDMHFVSASQLPYTALAAGLPWSTVLVPRSSCLPLCFLLQPPLGFLLIPVYSLFYKSL